MSVSLNREVKKAVCMIMAVATLAAGVDFPVNAAEITEEETATETEIVSEEETATETEIVSEEEETATETQIVSEEETATETQIVSEEEEAIQTTSENMDEETAAEAVEELRATNNIASGSYGNTTWVIDSAGKLTVSGTGELQGRDSGVPWFDYRDEIKTAVITVQGATDFHDLFFTCTNLTSVDFSKCDTSNIARMERMFDSCASLEQLDLSNFNTTKVTNMGSLFIGCGKLKSIKFGPNFKTDNVTQMQYMFYQCRELSKIDLSTFNTSKVTNMSYMFGINYALTSLDVSRFDTSKVTNMSHMFTGCSALTSLKLGSFNTSNVTDMSYMFSGSRTLTSLELGSFNTSSVTNMKGMFSGCSALTSLDVSRFNTSNVTDMSYMFNYCPALTSLNLSSFDMAKVTKTDQMLSWCDKLVELQTPLRVAVSAACPDGTWMKADGTELTELPRNQSQSICITQKKYLYASKERTRYCCGEKPDLTDLIVLLKYSDGRSQQRITGYTTNIDQIDMNTAGTKDLKITYQGQTVTVQLTVQGIKSLEISKKKTIYQRGDTLDLSDLTVDVRYDGGYRRTVTDYTTNAAQINMNTVGTQDLIISYLGATGTIKLTVNPKGTDIRKLTVSKEKTTYICGDTIDLSDLTVVLDFYNGESETTTDYTTNAADIDMNTDGTKDLVVKSNGLTATVKLTVKPIKMAERIYMADGFVFETGEKPDISAREIKFYLSDNEWKYRTQCESNIDELNMSTPGIKKLRVWKDDLVGETDIFVIDAFRDDDLGHRKYSDIACKIDKDGNLKVVGTGSCRRQSTEPIWMILPDVERNDIKTAELIMTEATEVHELFRYCKNLKTVDLSRFDTSKATNMEEMFLYCESLTSVDLSRFDTRNVTDMNYMFFGCKSLTSVDLSGFDTRNVTNMNRMFAYCESLTSVDLSGFDTRNVTDMSSMFDRCSSLTSANLSGFNNKKVTNMWYMFYNCSSLANLNLNWFGTENVTNMSFMFYNCSSLTNLDLSSFDTGNVTNMWYMFYNCASLKSLDLSKFDTGKVDNMGHMFTDCASLKSLDLSSFDMTSARAVDSMFDGCDELEAMYTPRNVQTTIDLPGTDWHDKNGKEYKTIPKSSSSIYIARSKKTEDEKPEDESSATEESSSREESSSIEESSKAEESSSIEESSKAEESSSIEESSKVEESSPNEESSEAAESPSREESSKAEESSASEESSEVGESPSGEESSEVKESSSSEESSKAEESSSSEENSSAEESSSREESSSETETSPYTDKERKDLRKIDGKIASIKEKTYDGNAYEPVIKVTVTVENGKKITLTEGADYSVAYQNNVKAGKGTVLVKGNGIYKGEIKATFTITPKPIKSLKVVTGSMTTGDKSAPPIYIYDDTKLLEKGTDYSLTYDKSLTQKASKSANVTVTAKGNYEGSKVVKLAVYEGDAAHIIQPENVTLKDKTVQYTGSAFKPVPTVTVGGVKLTPNKDYKVRYENNTNAGTAYVIVTGKGTYKGEAVKTFEITALKSSAATLTVSKISDKTYNGKLQKPSVTVKCGNKKLRKNKDYTITYTGNLHASANGSNAKVIITGIGNYAGITAEAPFTIKPQAISKASVKGTKENLVLTYANTKLKEGAHYTITPDESSAKKNKIKVTITGLGDFAGSTVTKTVKVK